MKLLNRLFSRSSDEALVAAVAQGDEQAFSRLVERYGPKVLGLAQRIVTSRADAEDITQEVFTKAWQEAAQWRTGKAAYTTWLYRVTLNLSLNWKQRVHQRFEPLDPHEPWLACPYPDAEQQLLWTQATQALQQALSILPESQQMAIQLRYGSGLSVAEIADLMEVTPKAVESLLVRARQGLRQHLVSWEQLHVISPNDALP
ncbi:RNA polymerase sigma-70 factor (ECF subfamily) [Azomonas agilis]|uniref:RNA polymerase sigma-70 factor (ECF subfamily) n=1 Tax=Azomonas agilis TaxID=116849 RepID=A0A562IZJ9_9GAMM|nr:sigma-70 family RNA polymerase sigma factor [Azomonas agilis]TWH75984.1 RNA polymerase sigma-70 factor (ECF subfamily) [Azomonas agilis]